MLLDVIETYRGIGTYTDAVAYLEQQRNDPRNQVMCETCGWVWGMVCPECPGCGCYNAVCSGWRHHEYMDEDERAELTACDEYGGNAYNPPEYHGWRLPAAWPCSRSRPAETSRTGADGRKAPPPRPTRSVEPGAAATTSASAAGPPASSVSTSTSPTTATPSGGMHLYFRALPGRVITSVSGGRSRLGAGIDVRGPGGRGGYLVGPDSVVNGRSYAITHDAPIQLLPDWLTDQLALPQIAHEYLR
ncbi:hypothetical protein GCM10022402_43320 [Salinactinospora qingdaonensis]|uniref:DNA primase/polymerase bifunctional N-terminal domain-containing protein n=1 Tax=Salinactinospora qingdaonensis TaxID=702744 RepID=A0ABP7GBN7_9ACTN